MNLISKLTSRFRPSSHRTSGATPSSNATKQKTGATGGSPLETGSNTPQKVTTDGNRVRQSFRRLKKSTKKTSDEGASALPEIPPVQQEEYKKPLCKRSASAKITDNVSNAVAEESSQGNSQLVLRKTPGTTPAPESLGCSNYSEHSFKSRIVGQSSTYPSPKPAPEITHTERKGETLICQPTDDFDDSEPLPHIKPKISIPPDPLPIAGHSTTSYQMAEIREGHVCRSSLNNIQVGQTIPTNNIEKSLNKTGALGRGQYGSIVTMFFGSNEYAVKKGVLFDFEFNALSELHHENIISLDLVIAGKAKEGAHQHYCYYFMPRLTTSLDKCLLNQTPSMSFLLTSEKKKVVIDNLKSILSGTTSALAYIHSKGYLHLNLKASCILIDMKCCIHTDGTSTLICDCPNRPQIKVTGFKQCKKKSIADEKDSTSSKHSEEYDIWSLGCLMSSLLTNCRPETFETTHPSAAPPKTPNTQADNSEEQPRWKKELESYTDGEPQKIAGLALQCILPTAQRPTAKGIIDSRIFSKVTNQELTDTPRNSRTVQNISFIPKIGKKAAWVL